jgi:hypothetical protein
MGNFAQMQKIKLKNEYFVVGCRYLLFGGKDCNISIYFEKISPHFFTFGVYF